MNNSDAPPRMGGMGKSSGPIKATVGMGAVKNSFWFLVFSFKTAGSIYSEYAPYITKMN
jgi:hypothetical protein